VIPASRPNGSSKKIWPEYRIINTLEECVSFIQGVYELSEYNESMNFNISKYLNKKITNADEAKMNKLCIMYSFFVEVVNKFCN